MQQLILLLSLLVSTPSFAYNWFPVAAKVLVAPDIIEASVYNESSSPIVCSGYAVGHTYYGATLYSYVNNIAIYPFQYGTTFIYSNAFDPFINGQAQIYCSY